MSSESGASWSFNLEKKIDKFYEGKDIEFDQHMSGLWEMNLCQKASAIKAITWLRDYTKRNTMNPDVPLTTLTLSTIYTYITLGVEKDNFDVY